MIAHMKGSSKEQLGLTKGVEGRLWFMSRSTGTIPPHRHDELEFNLAIAGKATYIVDDRRYDMLPGTLIWLFPEQDHVLVDKSLDYVMWLLVATPKLLKQVCTGRDYAPLKRRKAPKRFSKILTMPHANRLVKTYEQIIASPDDPALSNAGIAWATLETWRAFLDAEQYGADSDIHPAVEKAVHLIREGNDTHGIEELGEACGLSGSRLSRLFKQQIGVPLARFRQQQNLQRFFDLYQRGRRLNMTDAALQAGFGSYAQFHRVFTEQMGFSPRDYRRQLNQS